MSGVKKVDWDELKRTAQEDWDKRDALYLELKNLYPDLSLGHNVVGIYISGGLNAFLPAGKEKEAIELYIKHKQEWDSLIKSAPQYRCLIGYNLITKDKK